MTDAEQDRQNTSTAGGTMYSKQLWPLITGAILASTMTVGAAHADPEGKVGVCHRTASEVNRYVYIEVPEEQANGHITGTSSQHNQQVTWPTDGTWRGIPHRAGDPVLDYYASSAQECADTPSPEPDPDPSSEPEPDPSPEPEPTDDPVIQPPSTEPGPDNDTSKPDEPSKDDVRTVTVCKGGVWVTEVIRNGQIMSISTSGTCVPTPQNSTPIYSITETGI